MKTESKLKRQKSESIAIDFCLDNVSLEIMAQLSSSFLKFILFSKGLIPIPHNQLINYLQLTEKEILDHKFQLKDSVLVS